MLSKLQSSSRGHRNNEAIAINPANYTAFETILSDISLHKTMENGNDTVGTRCELCIWQQRHKRDGQEEMVQVDSLGGEHGHDKAYAIVINQVFSEQNRLRLTTVTINSAHILKAFREVIGSYPTVPADFTTPFDMESPFRMLYHFWEDLETYKDSVEHDEARMHMKLLLHFMEQEMGQERRRCETQVINGQVNYSELWTLYRPGDLLICFENDQPWLLRAVKIAYEENISAGKYMEVHCTHTDGNGKAVGQAKRVFKIYQKQDFASENPSNIRDLVVYPRKFFSEGDSLEKRLVERGAKFLTLQGMSVKQYDGQAEHIKEPSIDYYHPNMAEFDTIWWPFKETGRVVIDRKTFLEDNPHSQGAIGSDGNDLDKVLCPPFVYGFSLSRKEWCRYYLEHIHPADWKKNGFDELVMKNSQKSLLQALVSAHSFSENPRDQVQQKGKGLVILLHGTPGSGKTLTAECASETTERALLSTSMAELNKYNRAWYFEMKLKQFLQYATIWKAIVLLDEADVFLEARKDDVADATKRNALVAVFLRHLEYFSGIVFLTTNRIHVFDSAMKSRIHLTLGYNPPELEMRRSIWTSSLEAIPANELDMDLDKAVDLLIHDKLNGRQITYTISTARTLARFEGNPLRLKHIQTVLDVRTEFDMTLKRMASLEAQTSALTPLVRRGSLLETMVEDNDEESSPG